MINKITGSYYTPKELIKFMIEYVQIDETMKILEPSAGDGRFLDFLLEINPKIRIDAVDIIKDKVTSLKERYDLYKNVDIKCRDYIDFSYEEDKKYNLIIGNPPYISKKNINEEELKKYKNIISSFGLKENICNNIWVLFVLVSINLLEDNGSIFFVLPFEFLQVNYANELRKYLEKQFNKIHIVTFKERIFKDIEQEVCLVYLEKTTEPPHIRYKIFDKVTSKKCIYDVLISKNKPLLKWSNAIISDEEIEFLERLSDNYMKISELGDISPGIVTGANDFFIINRNLRKEIVDEKYTLKIISKSKELPIGLCLDNSKFTQMSDEGKKVYLLNLNMYKTKRMNNRLKQYINKGELDGISKRYKCSKRRIWYNVPIIPTGEVLFFKRYHMLPRIIVNEAEVYTTDMSYNLRLHTEYDKYSVVFCFYNSLTLTLCEYYGRFYGGGVGELTPNEFKKISIPYKKVDIKSFEKLDHMIQSDCSIQEITEFVDNVVFEHVSEDTDELINKLKNIRDKYISRRIEKNK